ncbi:hypothetical protein, partial [Bartonella schoenbuchensis]|uniref:hypothetical protein n=1 Tax=Bartonella schoenbuchensis TaxID=165694 RepID=UPI001ABB7A25
VKIEGDGKGKGRGLYVKQGQLSMLDTTLKNVAEGMTISEGSVMMKKGSIEFTDKHGVLLTQGTAVLNNVSMKYTGDNYSGTFLKVEA